MAEDQEEGMSIAIYVLPTQGKGPPRALLSKVPADYVPSVPEPGSMMEGILCTWSRDMGTWIDADGDIVPSDIAEAITAHAKELGVEW